MRPVNASVVAKQASKMLALVWSLGLLFTAIITKTLSRNVKGHVMPLMMIVMILLLISSEAFILLLSGNLLLMFVEFEALTLAMMGRMK